MKQRYFREIDGDYLIAGNPKTDSKVLDELSDSQDHNIRMRVAENQGSCGSTLYRLLFDEHPEVRLALLENEKTPPFFNDYLVNDSDSDVRFTLAGDQRLPVRLLRKLVSDTNPYVSEKAKTTIDKKKRNLCCFSGSTDTLYEAV